MTSLGTAREHKVQGTGKVLPAPAMYTSIYTPAGLTGHVDLGYMTQDLGVAWPPWVKKEYTIARNYND